VWDRLLSGMVFDAIEAEQTDTVAAVAEVEQLIDAAAPYSERFEILHLSGWAPSQDQPRPARRGSATASLADALRKKS